jgi:tRNA-dihydrouridine synthase B
VTGCAGVMIGRAALSTPWIFRDTWSYLTTGTVPEQPTIVEKVRLMCTHFRNLCELRNERSAVLEFRKRVSWYSKRMHPCRMLKEEVRLMDSAVQFEDIVRRFLDWRLGYDEDVRAGRAAPAVEETELVDAA